jgi:hypothetical protein
VNDGFDMKEGSHHVKYVNCTADFSGPIEPVKGQTYGSHGFYVRGDDVQFIKCSVLNLNNSDPAFQNGMVTVNSIGYGDSGNEFKQCVVFSGNGAFFHANSNTNPRLYDDCVAGPGGDLSSTSSTVIRPAASTFVEMIWSGNGGAVYGGLDPDIGAADPTLTPPPPPAAAPTFSVASGTYATAQSVALSSATSGATIYYTLNGLAPTTSSSIYSGTPILVSATTTIRAFATKSGMSASTESSATYTIGTGPVTLFSDNFNSGTAGSAPAGWTVSAYSSSTTAKVQAFPTTSDKSVRFTDTTSSGGVSITKVIAAQTSGVVTLEYKFQASTSTSAKFCKFYVQSGSTKVVEMYTNAGNLVYRKPGGGTSADDVAVNTYSSSAWTQVKVEMNLASKTFNIYVNGTLKTLTPIGFWSSSASSIDTIILGTGTSTVGSSSSDNVLTIDDVVVTKN